MCMSVEFFLGPIHGLTDYTYRYNKAIGNKTGIGYLIQYVDPNFQFTDDYKKDGTTGCVLAHADEFKVLSYIRK